MKRKPLQKLSFRLTQLFLNCVKKYEPRCFCELTSTTKACRDYTPIDLATELTKRVMSRIAEYDPEDIE